MFATNDLIIDFAMNNWIALILFAIFVIMSVWKIIPESWSFGASSDGNRPSGWMTINGFLFNNFLDTVIRALVIHLLTAFGLKNMVSLLIFIVVILDVFVRHQISTQAVALVSVGIIALYMDKLVDTGKTIKFFGNLFSWEKDDKK